MSDDIVTRLMNWSDESTVLWEAVSELRDSKKEIERLRADRDRWRRIAQGEHYAWSSCSYGCDCLTDIYETAVRGE